MRSKTIRGATQLSLLFEPDSRRQYVVIAAGGHGPLGVPRGDFVVAYALARK